MEVRTPHRASVLNRKPSPKDPMVDDMASPTESTTVAPLDGVELTSLSFKPKFGSAAIPPAIPGPIGAACALLTRELKPLDADSWDKAEAYYDKVRANDADIKVIAEHTPYSESQVTTIKNHLFVNTHELDDGPARFDADPLIANAWSRLSQGESRPGDLQLMEHELFEARFESLFDTDYRTAHDAANRSGRESGLY